MEFFSEEGADPVSYQQERPTTISFDELYENMRTPMVRLASFLVASRAEAEELTQDAFLELFRQWDRVENPAGLLRTLVVRRCTRLRSRRNTESRSLEIMGRRDDPYRVLSDEPKFDVTLAAVRRLKPDWRSVVVLRFYEDMSHTQIADALGCSEASVRTRLHRALVDLRRKVEI